MHSLHLSFDKFSKDAGAKSRLAMNLFRLLLRSPVRKADVLQ